MLRARTWKFLPILLLTLTFPLFFYKLGQSSLISFDEAWYADIARNILKTGNILTLTWSGFPYTDHPPAGFWFIAISQALFGVSEFSARFIPSLAGLLSLVITYLIGKKLFSPLVGLLSTFALVSAPWFIFRARSGNLDIILTLFFLLTLYLAIKASEKRKFLIWFFLSFATLLLIKTIVPLVIIPVLIVIFWKNKIYKVRDWLVGFLAVSSLFAFWFSLQIFHNPQFLQRFFQVGLPGVKLNFPFWENIKLVKEYLHSGVGKWFWPGILGVFAGPILLQKRFLILTVFFVSFLLPFLSSPKAQIWHLIPIFPIMILAFFGFTFAFIEKFIKLKVLRVIATVTLILFGMYYSQVQLKRNWNEFINIPPFISDEAILSKEAGKYPDLKFYIEGDFSPAASYYSDRSVEVYWKGRAKDLFETEDKFVLITNKGSLEQVKNAKFKVIKEDRDKILIIKE